MKIKVNGIEYNVFIAGVGECLLIEVFEGFYKGLSFTIHYNQIDDLNDQIADKINNVKELK